jgi:hypothetical protein
MLCIEASSAARASAICRRVSGECGSVEGEVEVGSGIGAAEDAPGSEGERDGALVLVDADADADPDILGGRRWGRTAVEE